MAKGEVEYDQFEDYCELCGNDFEDCDCIVAPQKEYEGDNLFWDEDIDDDDLGV